MARVSQEQEQLIADLKKAGVPHRDISEAVFGVRSRASTVHYVLDRLGLLSPKPEKLPEKRTKPRILSLDIETAPMLAYIWSLWQQGVGLNMLQKDWYIISWAAKWVGEQGIFYQDIRETVGKEEDASILPDLWELLNEADMVLTQNGKKFDIKKINSRFLSAGMRPPRPYKHVDILQINKRVFGHTSNKLEYIAEKFNIEFKKLKHKNFPGFELWEACLAGDQKAWDEMEVYNKHDILSLEEYYVKVAPWDNRHPNVNLYSESLDRTCTCGCTDWVRDGFARTNLSVFEQYRCTNCGAFQRGRKNLLSKEKRNSLQMNVL